MSLFITFEGIEGSGKTTQAKRLQDWLVSQGHECVFTMEPGGTRISEKIRDILLDNKNKEMSRFTELFLYLADRAQDVEGVIKPALLANKIVIADRYADSTFAYQGKGRGILERSIKTMNSLATQGIVPNLTILIDITPEVGFKRISHRDRMEVEIEDFYRSVRSKYLEIAHKNPDRVKVIDGMLSIDEIEKGVRELVAPLLQNYS